MEEQMERIEIPFTYTYDQFTVFFHGDHVFIGEKDFPIGQCCVDIMNLDESVFHEIDQRVREFVPAAQALLRKNRQRRSLRTGEAERCLGRHICIAGVPGIEDGRGVQLPHL